MIVELEMPTQESRPPFPPFTRATAIQKVRAAEDGWTYAQMGARK
jgi:nuclear transport factor 2 (NTF2) superfamily protein